MDSESKKAYHYVFAQKYTQQEVDEMLEQQRQECADKVHDCLQNYGIRQDAIYDASEACLDATGESDDK